MNAQAVVQAPESRWGPRHLFHVAVIFIGGGGFIYKFMNFAKTSIEGTLLGFAVVPLIVYLCIATGFACLLGWAVVGGQLSRIEESKERMVDYELRGDDPTPLPWTENTRLTPAGNVITSVFLVGSILILGWLMWVMFTPQAMSTGERAPTRMEVLP